MLKEYEQLDFVRLKPKPNNCKSNPHLKNNPTTTEKVSPD